jgi:hypothetical protein
MELLIEARLTTEEIASLMQWHQAQMAKNQERMNYHGERYKLFNHILHPGTVSVSGAGGR